jgi:hypothetical protein
MGLEFSVAQFVRAAWRYWRQPRRFPAGGGQAAAGYIVLAEPQIASSPPADVRAERQGELLWDV